MTECSPSWRPHLVEDEVMIALGLQTDIEALGFEVCGLAANAKQAISLAMNDRPDLVVMDPHSAAAPGQRRAASGGSDKPRNSSRKF